ncbi:MAG: hypothetical protein CMJ19_17815 [Phycisphaeraceae bacterium]|nr:hypothetical protein [Phycisphaeraceae bacterium]
MSRSTLTYWAASKYWQLTNRVEKNRQMFYNGAHGLRIVTFHGTNTHEFAQFEQIAQWCISHFDMATPQDADAMFAGQPYKHHHDQLLFTFDDGWQSNYKAAKWLHDRGICATFFIVPSLIDRSVSEFESYHKANGIDPYFKTTDDPSIRHEDGLTKAQVREMLDMGHRIGAHNYSHRNLGKLDDPQDIAYEIDRSVDEVSQLIGKPCQDFAIAFGQPHNLSNEACEHLLSKNLRTYLCFRGLNIPGHTCKFLLRHGFEFGHPTTFTQQAILGGVDQTVRSQHMEMIRRAGKLPLNDETS